VQAQRKRKIPDTKTTIRVQAHRKNITPDASTIITASTQTKQNTGYKNNNKSVST
jgi:hypothetical protein